MNYPLCFFSWLVAAYFSLGFLMRAGFPPKADLLSADALSIGMALFFLFLPFFNKIKVGSWLELERSVKDAKKDIAAAKEELREFKNEIRTTVSMVTTNTVNLTVAGAAELRRQGEKVEEKLDHVGRQKAEEVEQELLAEEDVNYALAKVRIDIERLLRLIVGKSLNLPVMDDTLKFMSLTKMFDTFVRSDTGYEYLRNPMKKVLAVCNAAVHAQVVSVDQADEALKLGSQIIAVLKQHHNAKS
jgi:hypothetical protein